MTVVAHKKEELQQELDASKKLLKECSRTRRQLQKVLQDAAFAVHSMLAVNIGFLMNKLSLIGYCFCVLIDFVLC